jgi:hypothetical protein
MKNPCLKPLDWMVLAGWALFVAAQACPAVAIDLGSWSTGEPKFVPGYFCTVLFWPYWFSNGLMLLSPGLLALRSTRKLGRRLRWAFSILCFISFGASFFLLPMFKAIHLGHWLWTASYLVAAIGAMPWQSEPARGDL